MCYKAKIFTSAMHGELIVLISKLLCVPYAGISRALLRSQAFRHKSTESMVR